MALFNQPWTTPSQVRQRVGSTLISGASLFPNVGAAMIGAAIGGGAAGLFDPKRNKELGQAVDLQNLQQQWAKTLSGLDMTTPEGVAAGGKIMVNDLIKANRADLAMQLSRELPQQQQLTPVTAKDITPISGAVTKMLAPAKDIKGQAEKLQALTDSGSTTDVIASAFIFMKALDPTSTVRETEQGQVYSAFGKGAEIAALINSLTGNPKLDRKALQELANTSKRLANTSIESAEENVKTMLQGYEGTAFQRQGFTEKQLRRVPEKFKMGKGLDPLGIR